MINGTLIVQIIHFLIFCGCVHWLILKHLVALVMSDRAKDTLLADEFEKLQRSIHALSNAKASDWDTAKRQFLLLIPVKQEKVDFFIIEKKRVTELYNQQEIAEHRKTLSRIIVQEVTRVSGRAE